jgi:hypothetical protein
MSTNAINGNSPPIPPMTDLPQLEASLNPTRDFGTRIRAITYDAPAFKNVEHFRAAFEEAEKGAHEAAQTKFKAEGDLILFVAKIQSYTSERGANAHLSKAAGIPAGFERWYTDFHARYDVEYAFKTVQHKIAQLHGGCEHCGRLAENDADHKKSCILYRPLIELAEPGANSGRTRLDMREATNAHYADRYLALVGLLTNAPKDASPQEIIATMRAEAESAYEDLDADVAAKIKVPKLAKADSAAKGLQAKLNEQEIQLNHRNFEITELEEKLDRIKDENDIAKRHIADNFEERLAVLGEIPENLRDENITTALAAQPDRGKAADMVQKYLQTVAQRILPPSMSMLGVTVLDLQFAGRAYRIEVGDWLEKQNTNAGGRKTLAKCTATAHSKEQMRPKLRDWDDSKCKWGREHMVYDDHADYKVVTEQTARALAPEAFPKEEL